MATTRGRSGRRIGMGALALASATGGLVLASPPAHALEGSADVSVAVSHDPAAPKTGDTITFTVSGANAGPDLAEDVVLGLGFEYPFEFVSDDGDCSLSYANGTSVLCDVGDVESGASADVEIAMRPLASGVYVVPAVVSSVTPDPDTSNQTVNDTLLVRRGPSQGERWTAGEFPTILDRPADAGAITYWGKKFQVAARQYPSKVVDIPLGIMNGNEYRRLRIREAYRRILGRAAGANDLTYWVAKAAGGLSYEAIERRLLTSAEFQLKSESAEDEVDAMYTALLGRAATPAEFDAVVRALQQGRTFSSVVMGVQRSNEMYVRLADRFTQLALGKDADALAQSVWKLRLGQGVLPERLFAQLLTSYAVLKDYPATNDDYEYGPTPIPAAAEQRTYDFTA